MVQNSVALISPIVIIGCGVLCRTSVLPSDNYAGPLMAENTSGFNLTKVLVEIVATSLPEQMGNVLDFNQKEGLGPQIIYLSWENGASNSGAFGSVAWISV
ncbi:hypothetical protein Pint_15315 [Pistacia integerrima]|uniref:Uncharacterized protein n=1 Tax=Pistacia integerrima TaxID=434235 RepID=A0ACC0ZH69_9ROSI|nr:hypothetical protein Pint_15315 [Pistacia integerrima]